MEDVFKRMINLWSLEIAMRSVEADREIIKTLLAQMGSDDIRTVLAKGLREHFIPENPDSTPYGIDDMVDFMQWLHDRFGLPTVVPAEQPRAKT